MQPYNGDPKLQECAQACRECHTTCLETVPHCLSKGGKHHEAPHILLLHNCATMCHTAANFTVAGSPLHSKVCGVCAAVCEECAKDCESMMDDDEMKKCAEACKRCAEHCKKMANVA